MLAVAAQPLARGGHRGAAQARGGLHAVRPSELDPAQAMGVGVRSSRTQSKERAGVAMAAGFHPPLAARLSPQWRSEFLLPLLAHAQQLLQGVTMYPSSSNEYSSLTVKKIGQYTDYLCWGG